MIGIEVVGEVGYNHFNDPADWGGTEEFILPPRGDEGNGFVVVGEGELEFAGVDAYAGAEVGCEPFMNLDDGVADDVDEAKVGAEGVKEETDVGETIVTHILEDRFLGDDGFGDCLPVVGEEAVEVATGVGVFKDAGVV